MEEHEKPPDYVLQLMKPAILLVQTYDGSGEARIDVCTMSRKIDETAKLPSQDKRWEAIRKLLADALRVDPAQLAESAAWEFHETIVTLTQEVSKGIRSKQSSIVSSQQPILESQVIFPAGQSSLNKVGLLTSDTSEQNSPTPTESSPTELPKAFTQRS